MRIKLMFFLWFCLHLMLLNTACADYPKASITLKVVDENGVSVSGAKAVATFEGSQAFTGKITNKTFSGMTDREGIFRISHSTNTYVSYGVEMHGFYESQGVFRFTKHESGKWQPWNPEIKVVMRKKENPVPMYARDLKMSFPNVEIPVIGKKVGFDLIEYDWVAPYGKGKHSDLIIKLDRSFKNEHDFDTKLAITFSNEFDGIQVVKDDRKGGSIFKLPRHAPEAGYQGKLTHFIRSKGIGNIEDDTKKDNNYLLRIRSEVKDGKLVRAMYGKIQGDIEFEPRGRKTAVLLFKYFLNPDYTRNLEWSGVNLFTLPRGEQVGTD